MTILFSKHHLVLLIVVAVSAGCGAPTVNYTMIPVEGVITFDGEPLSSAEVMFDSPDGPRGFGVSDENGRFSVKTRQFGAGLPAGKYRVLVTSSEKTRIRGAGKPVTLATSYRESGVARVSIEAGMQPLAFDLTAKPSKGGNAAGDGDGA
jgi:hypothetical protein